jgi:uncharacterized Fe-S cluster-containing radical SAM superfamily protein
MSNLIYKIAQDHVALNITRRCNQRCIFCFEGDRKGWDETSIDKIRELVSKARERGLENLIFMGAEALLRKDIFDIIRMCRELGMKEIGIFTNGQALTRPMLIENLYRAGMTYLDISFHYANPESFAIGTSTKPELYDNFLKGLEILDRFNYENGRKIYIIFKILLFSLNEGDLRSIIKKIKSIMKNSKFIIGIKRIQPVFNNNNTPRIYLLDNLFNRKKEIERLYPLLKGLDLYFTRVPLCIIPRLEHLSVDLRYRIKNSTVLANFENKKELSNMDDVIGDAINDPFLDICMECNLNPLCPRGSSRFGDKAFYPYESQKPFPFKGDVLKIIRRVANNENEYKTYVKNYNRLAKLFKAAILKYSK